MRVSKRQVRELGVLVGLMVMLSYVVIAANPSTVDDLTIVNSSRRDTTPTTVVAWAGNVTRMMINATSVTPHWAGFYGNISGMLTLDDASESTMYDWSVAEPQGKIYASEANPPTWASIDCLNFTSTFNHSELEEELSMDYDDEDGINETFCPGCDATGKNTPVNHSPFYVGDVAFVVNKCWAIATYVSDDAQAAGNEDFVEVLLQDGTDAIYMSIIEDKTPGSQDGQTGFNGENLDFQIMVGEDGNGSQAGSGTDYYFYVELE